MNKKIRFVILIVILILLSLIINSTYSKYINKSSATIDEKVGKWKIKINGTDVTTPDENGKLGNFEITDFEWSKSSYVAEGKVAPGMQGYFTLRVDPTGTDVSIKYAITIDDSKIAEMLNITGIDGGNLTDRINLKITNVYEDGEALVLPRDEKGNIIISKTKELEEIQSDLEEDRIDELVVEVTWINNEDNNDIDSQIGSVANNIIHLPVKVDVIQWTGE